MDRILVCDDDEGIAELIKTILEENHYQVQTLNSSKGIKRRIQEFRPKLILLDIWMPGMDGKETVKMLKKDTEVNTPIVIISALNEGGNMATKCGADGFLAKPFDLNDLLEIVKKYTN